MKRKGRMGGDGEKRREEKGRFNDLEHQKIRGRKITERKEVDQDQYQGRSSA